MATFQDLSAECAICLESLNEGETLTLKCGHRWHYDCIRRQLETAQPKPGPRLLFGGCRCAKCGSICEHERLENVLRATDDLRHSVDRMIGEQLSLEAPCAWKQAEGDPSATGKLLDEGRRKYAFYLCSHCNEPYFGGTVECADQVDEQPSNETRLCVACSPLSQLICRNPLEHRSHLTWKCRFCCQVATHLCYGNVHFCDDCHARNSQRYRQQPRDRNPITPIPCPGQACPFPKPPGNEYHSNGPTFESESVYNCACCQSTAIDQRAETLGSPNLLKNPSGQEQLDHWRQGNSGMHWTVEESELPVDSDTTVNFVSSYLPCIMQQQLDLQDLLTPTAMMRTDLEWEVSARYKARTDCPSVFCLQVVWLDSNHRILQRATTGMLEGPPDFWERAELILRLPERARYLVVVVVGKDSRFWQGRFGSKVCKIQVRLLGENWSEFFHRDNLGRHFGQAQEVRGRVGRIQRVLVEGLFPIVLLLIIAWLMR